MELDSSFAVQAPVARVWATLMDIERVAGCLPGAEVLGKTSEDAYQLGVKVKLGPVTMAYRGNLDVAQRDEANHRAVLSGQAKETRGQGTAKATATMTLTESGGTTTGVIHTDLSLSGKAAAMGKSVIGTVSEQLMKQFAANLQTMIDAPAEGVASEPAVVAAAATDHTNGAAAGANGAAHARPSAPDPAQARTAAAGHPVPAAVATEAPNENTLDALALAKGVALGQLEDPKKLLALLTAVGALAFLLGRRSGLRHR